MPGKIRSLIQKRIDSATWSDLELWKIGRGDVGESDPRKSDELTSRVIYIYQGDGDNRKIGKAVVSTNSGIRYDKKSLKRCIGLECWVGIPDTADPESKTLYVKELSPKALAALDGLSPMEQIDNEAVFTDPANLTNLRVEVTGTKEITVAKGMYKRPSDGNIYRFNESRTGFNGNDSVASLIPGSAGQHRIVWTAVDRETGSIKVVASAAVAAVGSLPQRSQLIGTIFSTSVTATYKRIVPIYLYYGQSQIAEIDVYRQFDARIDSTAINYIVSDLTTTNNTATDIATVSVAELSAITIKGIYSGAKSDYSASIGGSFEAHFRRASGGNVTLVGSANVTSNEDSGGTPSLTLAADTSNQTADIRVTGITAETWSWRVSYEIVKV